MARRGVGSGATGAFVGMQHMEYGSLAQRTLGHFSPYLATGGPMSVAAGRLAYVFGLAGPAQVVDTAW